MIDDLLCGLVGEAPEVNRVLMELGVMAAGSSADARLRYLVAAGAVRDLMARMGALRGCDSGCMELLQQARAECRAAGYLETP